MVFVIAYDIQDDRQRAKMARLLEGYGTRLQKSVFAVEIPRYRLKRLLRDLRALTAKEDRVMVTQLCSGCQRTARHIGEVEQHVFIM
jgi:CRISPR-associated protein Cas2